MSEVKRYWVHWNDQLYVADKNGDLVMAEDFDRVTAERDAALETVALKQRDLIEAQTAVTGWARKFDALQARLTAADERADVLERVEARYRWLQKATQYQFKKIQGASVTDGGDVLYFHADRFDAAVDAALKPAEGGGVYDEMTDADWQLKDDMDRYDDEKERS